MPTYIRDSDRSVAEARDVNGTQRFVGPGEEIQTYEILGDGWTLVDAAPYWNPALAVHEATGVDQTIELNEDTELVEVWNNSPAVVTAFFNSVANTPGIRIEPYGIRTLPARRRVSSLILTYSVPVLAGQVIVTERKD